MKMRTIRDHLNKKIRVWQFVPAIMLFASLVPLCFVKNHWPIIAFSALGLVLIVGAAVTIIVYGRMRCPRCGNILMMVARDPPWPIVRIPKRIRYCPFCALDLDKEEPVEPVHPGIANPLPDE